MTVEEKNLEYLLNRIDILEEECKMWQNKFHEQTMDSIFANSNQIKMKIIDFINGEKNEQINFFIDNRLIQFFRCNCRNFEYLHEIDLDTFHKARNIGENTIKLFINICVKFNIEMNETLSYINNKKYKFK